MGENVLKCGVLFYLVKWIGRLSLKLTSCAGVRVVLPCRLPFPAKVGDSCLVYRGPLYWVSVGHVSNTSPLVEYDPGGEGVASTGKGIGVVGPSCNMGDGSDIDFAPFLSGGVENVASPADSVAKCTPNSD